MHKKEFNMARNYVDIMKQKIYLKKIVLQIGSANYKKKIKKNILKPKCSSQYTLKIVLQFLKNQYNTICLI